MRRGVTASLPAGLRSLLMGASLVESAAGRSGAQVFRVESGQAARFLKVAKAGERQDLLAELSRLLWLNGKLPVPSVLYFAEHEGSQYLLMTTVPGVVLSDESVRDMTAQVIERYAEGLRSIHSLPLEGCPFDARLEVAVSQAHRNVLAGVVDTDDFDDERLGRTAKSLYEELLETCPTSEDLVFTHGDYCVPNVLVDPIRLSLTGYVDWGRAGVADRYQDLALAARSIAYNFGEEWVRRFFEAYGIREPDGAKIAFYELLDEFF